MQRFYDKKLNNAEAKEYYQVKIRNRSATLENMDDNVENTFGFTKIISSRSKVLNKGKIDKQQ
jgi:hypothetical protein